MPESLRSVSVSPPLLRQQRSKWRGLQRVIHHHCRRQCHTAQRFVDRGAPNNRFERPPLRLRYQRYDGQSWSHSACTNLSFNLTHEVAHWRSAGWPPPQLDLVDQLTRRAPRPRMKSACKCTVSLSLMLFAVWGEISTYWQHRIVMFGTTLCPSLFLRLHCSVLASQHRQHVS